MRKIAVLDQNTIDKIAAGEVVERPASVVKELVENAIDAGADAVTVEIKDGGISFIRITDNGCGISKEQVPLAFLRHATSKIESALDLTHLVSLGFRGEALSSIAAVSQMELITKTKEDMTGTRYVIEGGKEKSLEDVGAPEGTTFLIRNLFFNTPVRLKFLKTPATEGSYVSGTVEQLALSNPQISFKFVANGQVRLHTTGNLSLKDTVYGIYGREIARELIALDYEKDGISIGGYAAKPSVSRGNRNYENYYVNGRCAKNHIVTRAIEDAYRSHVMQHKYPFTALSIQVQKDILDVNVHPTKKEVRFSNEPVIYNAVYDSISQALNQKEQIPKVRAVPETPQQKPVVRRDEIPEPFEQVRRIQEQAMAAPVIREDEAVYESKKPQETTHEQPPVETKHTENVPHSDGADMPVIQDVPAGEQLTFFEKELLAPESRSSRRVIGQIFDTYWLVEFDGKLFIVDQHAAHEKVLYEKIMREYEKKAIASQQLSPPMVVSLNMEEETTLLDYMDTFRELGFAIEPFGGKEYTISGVPYNLYNINSRDLFIEILDNLSDAGSRVPLAVVTDRLATAACKAAVKGNHAMSFREAEALIDELMTLENPYQCPHGRPTIISMSKSELDKKFRRIL